jgi:hypothetical protein
MKKPDWYSQAEKDAEEFANSPLGKYSDARYNALFSLYECPKCKEEFNIHHINRHGQKCEELQKRNALILELNDQGLTNKEIIKHFKNNKILKQVKISAPVVVRILKNHDRKENFLIRSQNLEQQVLEIYESGIHNYAEIARILNKPPGTIAPILTKRNQKVSERGVYTEEKDQKILEAYHDGTRPSSADIARRTGYIENTIKNTLKKYGLTAWNIIKTQENRKKIIELHLEGKTEKQIKEITGMSHGSVNMIIRDYKLGKFFV